MLPTQLHISHLRSLSLRPGGVGLVPLRALRLCTCLSPANPLIYTTTLSYPPIYCWATSIQRIPAYTTFCLCRSNRKHQDSPSRLHKPVSPPNLLSEANGSQLNHDSGLSVDVLQGTQPPLRYRHGLYRSNVLEMQGAPPRTGRR